MVIREIISKSILSRSKIYNYVLNPYVGCQFGCSYCYARYMKRFTGHREKWGDFVDIKINAIELLRKEVVKKKVDEVWISGVCDPYQPLEAKYKLTSYRIVFYPFWENIITLDCDYSWSNILQGLLLWCGSRCWWWGRWG